MKTKLINDLYALHPLHRKQIEREYPETFGLFRQRVDTTNNNLDNPALSFARDIIHSMGVLVVVLVVTAPLAYLLMQSVK